MGNSVYILYSTSKDKYYIGQTNCLDRRVKEHSSGLCISTKAGRPWELVYTKNFVTRSEAMKYELYLKSMKSKSFIRKLIETG
jgi:putative endonuclease